MLQHDLREARFLSFTVNGRTSLNSCKVIQIAADDCLGRTADMTGKHFGLLLEKP